MLVNYSSSDSFPDQFRVQTRYVVLLTVRLCFKAASLMFGGASFDAVTCEVVSSGNDEGVIAVTEKLVHQEAFVGETFASLQASIKPWSILPLCFESSSSSMATTPPLLRPCPDPVDVLLRRLISPD
mmetsp:Transcript_14653/g.21937  ORF Transcript_14653/g.21937 Transcript_14653/m.21937 type:complete len:127 (-) Transcript_14653:341-721(-)